MAVFGAFTGRNLVRERESIMGQQPDWLERFVRDIASMVRSVSSKAKLHPAAYRLSPRQELMGIRACRYAFDDPGADPPLRAAVRQDFYRRPLCQPRCKRPCHPCGTYQ